MDIRITPAALDGCVMAPPSKSAAHRAFICAALADGESRIKTDGMSEDTAATVRCLEAAGAVISRRDGAVNVAPIKNPPSKAVFDCGESGSTLRFMLPVAAALGIEAEFTGGGKLPERPIEPLLEAMREHGVSVGSGFPIKISGRLAPGRYEIAGNVSSQFITGLLLALPLCRGESELKILPPVESKPYIDITVSVLEKFGASLVKNEDGFIVYPSRFHAADLTVEGDWSNAAFWLACGAGVRGLDADSAQGDKRIIEILKKFGAEISDDNGCFRASMENMHSADIDAADIPDLVPIISVIASAARGKTVIYNASRLRLKESDRLKTTAAMINSLGGSARETGDGLVIEGSGGLRGGEVDGGGDHRIVMSAAAASVFCDSEVVIRGAQAVTKSYPDFFEKFNRLGGKANVMQLR